MPHELNDPALPTEMKSIEVHAKSVTDPKYDLAWSKSNRLHESC